MEDRGGNGIELEMLGEVGRDRLSSCDGNIKNEGRVDVASSGNVTTLWQER